MMAKLLAKFLKKNSLDITFQKTRCIVLAQCHVSGGTLKEPYARKHVLISVKNSDK